MRFFSQYTILKFQLGAPQFPQFWQHLPRDSFTLHRLRAQANKIASLLPTSDASHKSSCHVCYWLTYCASDRSSVHYNLGNLKRMIFLSEIQSSDL